MIYSKLDQLIALTPVHKVSLIKNLPINADKIVIIPNGVDPERFIPYPSLEDPKRQLTRKELGATSTDILIGTVGRYDRQKGQMELLEAVAKLKVKHANLKFVMIGADTFGEEPLQEKIIQHVKDHNLQDVVQVRGFSNNVQEYMAAFDIFVMPSYKETFGIVLAEAMSCECICLATNAGGPIDILEQGNLGVLVAPKSAQAIEKGIESIIQDLPAYRAKGKASRQAVLEQYQYKKTMQSILNLVDNKNL